MAHNTRLKLAAGIAMVLGTVAALLEHGVNPTEYASELSARAGIPGSSGPPSGLLAVSVAVSGLLVGLQWLARSRNVPLPRSNSNAPMPEFLRDMVVAAARGPPSKLAKLVKFVESVESVNTSRPRVSRVPMARKLLRVHAVSKRAMKTRGIRPARPARPARPVVPRPIIPRKFHLAPVPSEPRVPPNPLKPRKQPGNIETNAQIAKRLGFTRGPIREIDDRFDRIVAESPDRANDARRARSYTVRTTPKNVLWKRF